MRRPAWIVLSVVGVALLAPTLADPLAFVADDSWFYLVIARNIVDGRGITFSGTMGTNGFQPLWQAVVTPVVGGCTLIGLESPEAQMRAVLLVAAAILAALVLLTHRLLRRLGVSDAAVAIPLLGLVVALGGVLGTIGSEANLVALLVVAVILSTLRVVDGPSPQAAAAGGACMGLLVLGRLDSGFVAAAALGAICLFGSAPRRTRCALAALSATVAAAVVAPYLLWNQVRFGHLLPISGAIKLDTGTTMLNWAAIGYLGVGLLMGGVLLAFLAWIGRRPARDEVISVAVPFLGGAIASTVYVLWAPGRFTDLDWYRMPMLVAGAIAASSAAGRLDRRCPSVVRRMVWIVAVSVVPAALFLSVERRMHGANHRFWHPVAEFSVEVGERVPSSAVIASVDFPGVLAMYSDRDVVALDGLTGDFAFQRELRDRGASCALAHRNVRYLVVDDSDRLQPVAGGFEVEVGSWLFRVPAGTLRLDTDDRVLAGADADLSLWRVRPQCPS